MTNIKSEEAPAYLAPCNGFTADERRLIDNALSLLQSRLKNPGEVVDRPQVSRDYFTLRLSEAKAERFEVLFLDNKHRMIECRTLFHGTIDDYADTAWHIGVDRLRAGVLFIGDLVHQ